MTIYSIYTSATDCNYEQPHFYFKSHDLCLPSYTFSNISIIYFSLVRKTKRDTVDLPTVVGWSGADNLPYEKVGKNEPVCIADEVPFEIPDSWEWVRVSSLGIIVRGSGIKRTEIVESGKPCVRYGELYTTYHTSFNQAVSFVSEELFDRCKHFSYGDILMTLTGENKPDIAKAVAYLGNDLIAAGGDLAYWTAHGMNPLYLTYLMASPYMVGRKINLATGDIIVHISGDKLGTVLIPIPPLTEQQRIIDKILEAEVKLAEYTGKENLLNVLQKNFPDALKKSILQEAVQGKLVPQDPTDEPASVLLERIRAEKQKLIAEGKIKRDKHESVIFRRDNSHYEKLDGIERCIDDEIPFEIPDSWVWTRLGQVISLLSGTDFKPEEYNDVQKGIPYITGASSLSENGVLLNRWTETPKVIANFGDVLLVCKGSGYGKTVICDIEEAHIARQIMAIKKFITLDMHYLRLFLQANLDQIKSKGQGVIPGIDRNSVMNLLFPVPPLLEQHRIVEKQRELFTKITLM